MNDSLGMKQYLVPYLMSSHPGSTLKEAIELAEYLRDLGYMPEQVQDFYPTPSTLSTCMYYTGYDPRTMEKVYVPTNPHEKAMQRALIQYRNPKNYDLVLEALRLAGRTDLIGFDKKCLIRPRQIKGRDFAAGCCQSCKRRQKTGCGRYDRAQTDRRKWKWTKCGGIWRRCRWKEQRKRKEKNHPERAQEEIKRMYARNEGTTPSVHT